MKTLELFAGSRSFTKVAQQHGFKTYTTDNQDFNKIDQVCDIFDFNIDKAIDSLGGEPNVIFPLSTIQRYAQTQYGGEATEALQTFVSDVMKPDVDNFAQQLETKQANVPPGNEPQGLMTSPQNMETV